MKNRFKNAHAILIWIIAASVQLAQASETPFFDNTAVQHFIVEAPFAKINQAQKNSNFLETKAQRFDGFLSYTQDGKTYTKLPITLSIKGFTSINFCQLPKLEIKINSNLGTIFDGIKKIDLNTHCDDPKEVVTLTYKSMFNAHREAVAYRIQKVLGMRFYLTKPVWVKYIDIETGLSPQSATKDSYQAFFIEDKKEFIKRNQVIEIKGVNDPFKIFDVPQGKYQEDQYQFLSIEQNKKLINLVDVAQIELFQNFIGNSDWFIKAHETDARYLDAKNELWNTKMFKKSEVEWFPLAQDFNFSHLSFIEATGGGFSNFPLNTKFYNMLDVTQRRDLLNHFLTKKDLILKELDLIKNDPEYSKIKNSLENRFQFINTELNK